MKSLDETATWIAILLAAGLCACDEPPGADAGAPGPDDDAGESRGPDGGTEDAGARDGGPARDAGPRREVEVSCPQPLVDLRAGHWYEAPDTRLEDALPPPDVVEHLWNNNGPDSIVTAWSGGAFDSHRNRLIVWGGGHLDWAGNAIYVFDVNELRWERVNEPSLDNGGDEASGYYPDGLPRSRHTYDYLEYLPPPVDRFCSFGGAAMFPEARYTSSNTDCYDFETGQWEQRADTPTPGIGATSAYDPATGRAWAHGGGGGAILASFDYGANRWSDHVLDPSGWTRNEMTAEIDPVARRYVTVGGGLLRVWRLDAPDEAPRDLSASAPPVDAMNPGVAYDPRSEQIIAWSGGAEVYGFDAVAETWTVYPPAADNTTTPTPPASNGTFGRWRYSTACDVFMVVNDIDQNVFFYRL